VSAQPCQYLNDRWYAGYGDGFRDQVSSENPSFEARCIKGERCGLKPELLTEQEAERCRECCSSRCWRNY